MEEQQRTKPQGKLVLLIGPSGVGKSVILRHLQAKYPSFHFPRSATTRPQRPQEGTDLYRFVTEEEFDSLLQKQAFIETAVVHGAARYGTLKEEILPCIEAGQTVIREVDVQGFDTIRHDPLFAGENPPYRLQSIFIVPENTEQLIRRITKRAPISEKELQSRIASMDIELSFAKDCTTRIVNVDGRLEDTIAAVEQAIQD